MTLPNVYFTTKNDAAATPRRRRGHLTTGTPSSSATAAPLPRERNGRGLVRIATPDADAPSAPLPGDGQPEAKRGLPTMATVPRAPIDEPGASRLPAAIGRSSSTAELPPAEIKPARKSGARASRLLRPISGVPAQNFDGQTTNDVQCSVVVDASGHMADAIHRSLAAGEISADHLLSAPQNESVGSAAGMTRRHAAPKSHLSSRRKTYTVATGAELDDLILQIRDLHIIACANKIAAGDMERRIKAKRRWAAVARIKAAGGTIDPKKFPKPTAADELRVLQLYPQFHNAAAVLRDGQVEAEKVLDKLVRRLPIYDWCKSIRGISEQSIAALVGESGNIGNYSNSAKLWKRWGVGIVRGQAQRRVKDAALAVAMGYDAERRAQLWVIGENICLRSQEPYYRELYLSRKAYERPRVDSDMHAHKRAMRYAQKRFLRKLWSAWRTASKRLPPMEAMPPAKHPEDRT